MPIPDGEKPAFVFAGFDSPNTTQVPDAFFDVVAPQLSEAELRVALYIIRRTFGFKKDTDNISLRQMVEGITTKDGRVLDRGTGLRKSAVANALNGLERKGVILSKRNRSPEKGNEPTTYALNIRNHPLSVPVDKGLSIHADKPLSVPVDTQYTDRQETVEQQTAIISNSFEGEKLHINAVDGVISKNENSNFVYEQSAEDENDSNSDNDPSRRTGSAGSTGFSPVGQVLSRRRGPSPKTAPRSPKNGSTASSGPQDDAYYLPADTALSRSSRGRPPKATEQIEAVLEQISGEFHDSEHLRSNIGQAARLWKASGRSEGHFVQLMYEARSITKQRGDIQKQASGEAGEWGVRNRMPYFFVVVRDLLGMKEEQGAGDQAGRSNSSSSGL